VFRMHGGTVITGKVGYAVSCVVAATVLLVSGYAYHVESQLSGIGGSNVDTGGPQTGAMNILLMGLESRTDWNGNPLPRGLEDIMHVGSVGGQATNTLILLHIFADGKKAVGISVPRDDWITFPKPYDGQSQGKIDQAYGLAWAQSLSETINSSMSHDQRYLVANEAGQAAAIASVEALTGQHIDHFAEMNLDGFYYLAQAFNGIEVCVKSWNGGQNLHDANSGFNQPHAGYLHLAAPQALSFVRERDNLPNGDIDRTHRQQAVIDYVIWKLKHQGVLSDIGQINALLSTARQFLITSGGWNLAEFAGEMQALTGKNLRFETAQTITTDGHMAGQTVNLVDPAAIQQEVKQAFTAPPASSGRKKAAASKPTPAKKTAPIPPPSTVTVDVYNGGTTPGLAHTDSQALASVGYKAGTVGTPSAQSQPVQSATQVFYGAGTAANAAKIARYFGATATAAASLAAGHVEVLLGTTATAVPASLGSSSGSAAGSSGSTAPATTPSAKSKSVANDGTVTVKANAQYGIPCVY
jgi:LCP family protein required for cell wall assembly